jgi:hypothetical protein
MAAMLLFIFKKSKAESGGYWIVIESYESERPSSLILGRERPRFSNFLEGNHL